MAPRLIPLTLATALLTLGGAAMPSHATTPTTATTPAPTQTAAAPTKVLVLGDSYSAGNGAGHYYGSTTLQAECRRSHDDYGNLYGALETADGHPTKVTVAACSGAVTDSYWNAQYPDLEPQQAAVNPSYDEVMLTLGGNDAKFSNLVQGCLIGLTASPSTCESALSFAEGTLADGTISTRLSAVLSDIESRLSPNAKVVLVGYPYLESDTSFTVGDVQAGARLRTLQQGADTMESDLVDALNAKTANKPFVFVATSPLYEGQESWLPAADQVNHEVDAAGDNANPPVLNSDRWITVPFVDAGPADMDTFYHPNPAGWAAEAQLLIHDTDVPDAFGSGTGWTNVVVGNDRACGVRAGTTWCWGGGHSDARKAAQLPTVRQKRAQAPAGTTGEWRQLSTNGKTTCGVKKDGTGWCWGSNAYGQVGKGAPRSHPLVSRPVRVNGHHLWKQISVGAHQTCGILRGGRLACWGADLKGALGRVVTTRERKHAVTMPAEIRMPEYDATAPTL